MFDKIRSRLRKADWGGRVARHPGLVRAVLFGAGFALVVLLIHREVYSFLAQRRQFAVPDVKTALAPGWADDRGAEVVKIDVGRTTLFDPDIVEKVGSAFEACPWIRRVTAVERVFPDQLRVRFEYRRPHLAVRRENGYVLVDEGGVRLPGVYVEPPTCDRAVAVAGVRSAPPEPGRKWEDPALRAGMEMADLAQTTPLLARLGVREVNVANFGGRVDPRQSELSFTTSLGCELAWGRTPAASKYGDLTTEEKLENLREVLAAYPGLVGLRRAKIYFRGSRGAVEPLDSHVQNRR